MPSVTQVIKSVRQPTGGYINPRSLEKITLSATQTLYEQSEENISASLVGIAVDYLTRFLQTNDAVKAFTISLRGASLLGKSEFNNAYTLLQNLHGLDDLSIISACKLVGYDSCFRAGLIAYKPVEEINPNQKTIENIREMVTRSQKFFEEYGPVTADGFTFEGGYTDKITTGDGDFLTKNTLWDFKVSKNPPTAIHTLQLLVYYIMGKHSIHSMFNNIEYIAIFNPRLNMIYRYAIKNIPQPYITEIEREIIGY